MGTVQGSLGVNARKVLGLAAVGTAGTATVAGTGSACQTGTTSTPAITSAGSRGPRRRTRATARAPATSAPRALGRIKGARRRDVAPIGATARAPLRPSMQASARTTAATAVAVAPTVGVATPSRSTSEDIQSNFQTDKVLHPLLRESCLLEAAGEVVLVAVPSLIRCPVRRRRRRRQRR